MWRPCDLVPLGPEAMIAWLENHRAIGQLVEKIAHLAGEAHTLAELIASFDGRLRVALGGMKAEGRS
jgi:hypothetical protein